MSQLRSLVPNSCDMGEVTSDQDYAPLDALVNGSPEALIAISPEGRVLSWNRGAETIFGFTSAEARCQPLFDFGIPPDRLHETRDALQEALRNGHGSRESVRRRRTHCHGRGGMVPLIRALISRSDSAPLRQGAHNVLRSLSAGKHGRRLALVMEALEGPEPISALPVAALSALEEL